MVEEFNELDNEPGSNDLRSEGGRFDDASYRRLV